MDPLHCTVVILQQPKPQPFLIDDNNHELSPSAPPYLSLLKNIFAQVSITSHQNDALTWIKEQPSTLLLLDLDDQDDDSLGCFANTTWVSTIVQQIDDDNVPVIVLSSNETPSFMLDCIHAGAADYILKPMRIDVVKTLFLALHRQRSHSKMHDDHRPSPTLSSDHVISPDTTTTTTTTTTTAPITPTSFQPLNQYQLRDDSSLQRRIKDLVQKDTLLTKAVMDIYATSPPVSFDMSISSEYTKVLQHKIDSWCFSPFELSHQDLIHCVILIFKTVLTCPELDHLIITQEQLYDFINDLSNVYHDENPYHNFAHAVDVLQCSYYTLCQLGVLPFEQQQFDPNDITQPQQLLRPIDVLGLFIAAIGHDAAHPGVNNLFLINSATPLAMLYNDRSVLESFHSMTLFQLMKKHGLDQISGGTGTSNYQGFRKTVVSSILATDMSLHNDYVMRINEQAARFRCRSKDTPIDEEQERLIICSAIIKCADISNVARPFQQSKVWAELLVEEFACQGDLEKELGMTVSPLNDRDKLVLEESQIGFIRFVAMGLFQRVRDVMKEMSFAVEEMESNLQRWEHRKQSTHDSGVSTLNEKEDSRSIRNNQDQQPLLPKNNNSNSNNNNSNNNNADRSNHNSNNNSNNNNESTSPYHVQAVESLHPRLSIDPSNNELSSMPAMAMTHYAEGGKGLDHHDQDDRSSFSHYNSTIGNQPLGWNEAPVYCQCNIQ
ncbi:unnamed protein product [Cunninghamella blakesleeana]